LLSLDDIRSAVDRTSWVWRGYLAAGSITLLISQWKSGKTTLASILIARMKAGGLFAGLPVMPGRAIVVSEESPDLWRLRSQKLDFGDHVGWFCRPFRGRPHPFEWQALMDRIAELHAQRPLRLIVIDPFVAFLPGYAESDAAGVLETLMPLQRLASQGIAVLILHHPKKGETRPGQAARGTGALAGYVDIVLEMDSPRRRWDTDRRRRLRAYSRYDETPRRLLMELTPDATDYLAAAPPPEDPDTQWPLLRSILANAPAGLTRQEIRDAWPAGAPAPDDVSLWRYLQRAVTRGDLHQSGHGRKRSPFRYHLSPQANPDAER
jgi:hypothetical protein